MKMITRQELAAWLDSLTESRTLIAPHSVSGVLLYQPVQEAAQITWDFTRPTLSAKDSFFPATEQLLVIEKTGQEVRITETQLEQETILFGIRPCDVRGLQALDALFIEAEPVDPYYARRRAQTTLIGLACRELGSTCFCTSLGGAPDDPGGMDIMLREVDGGYVMDVLTEKGQAIVDEKRLSEVAGDTTFTSSHTPANILRQESWPAQFNDGYWTSMAERCLSCRICAYVCPTCRCFDLRDEALPSENGRQAYERIRCWDSCNSVAYRRVAGGHNPRAEKGQRLRNRFFCKFYYYPQQYGPLACTGCGRCVDACPVNIDITEVLEHVRG
jgi:sulfhydrogenase subunit beta (sulfur reductase)